MNFVVYFRVFLAVRVINYRVSTRPETQDKQLTFFFVFAFLLLSMFYQLGF